MKQINRRMKGTEKFWREGAEPQLQLCCDQLSETDSLKGFWNRAATSPITLETVNDATPTVVERLDQNFFRVRYDRLTPAETRFLRAMAEHGAGPHRTGDIADTLGVKVTSQGPMRARLINKGMIYSPAYGDLAFTVPLFDQFMIRALPSFVR